MIKQVVALCWVAVLLCGAAAPQVPTTPTPMISDDPEDDIAGVIDLYRQEIPRRMEQEKVPGLAIAVVDDQNVLWAEGFGYTDWDRRTPVTEDTLFSIQSMSKSFTATAAMFAAQDGLVDLDAPITTYLPDFHVNSIFEEHPEQKITLRMLLSHTAGFAHEAPFGGNYDHPEYSFEKHVASISDTWLRFPVGTRYSYSNLGIDLAGYILQVQAGMPFTDYVQQKVLTPLGMTNSTLDVSRVRATPGRAIGHLSLPLSPPVDWLLIPSGGVWTTAEDMARYLLFHIHAGALDGTRLLREDLAETMYTPPNIPAHYSALGIVVIPEQGVRRFEHGGGGFGFLSQMVWYPELKLGVVVLTNSEDSELRIDLTRDVLQSFFDINRPIYAERAANAVHVEPAYPPSLEGNTLYDNDLITLIASKGVKKDAASIKRREGYTGMYIMTKWGIPYGTAEVKVVNGELEYSTPDETGSLTEVEPGLFFGALGDTFDLRGTYPTALNVKMVKADTQALPFLYLFYGLCGLIFLSTLFFWPARAVVGWVGRKNAPAIAAPTGAPRNRWLAWTGILAGLASLFSLLCLVVIAGIPNMVYVPWPRPYMDLPWWQYAALCLPFASLLLAAAIALLSGLAVKNRTWRRGISGYYLMVALLLLAANLVIIL